MRRIVTCAAVTALLVAGAVTPAIADPPDESGVVERLDDEFFWATQDFDAGLLVFLGWDIRDWVCGEGAPDDVIVHKTVDLPMQPERIVAMAKGEVRTFVWPLFDDIDFCVDDPLAEGTSDLVLTDNDTFAFAYDTGPNHNSYGVSAHGKLLSPSGELMHFSMHDRAVWDGDDFDNFRVHVEVNLH